MVLEIKPGGRFTFTVGLREKETLTPIAGVDVSIQMYDEIIGAFTDIVTGRTDTRGIWSNELDAPSVPGSYRYRSAFKGTDKYEPDYSPVETLRVRE